MQREVLNQLAVGGIGEENVLEIDFAAGLRKNLGVGRVGILRGLVNQLKDASGAGERVLQLGDDAGNLVERLGVLIGVGEEAGQTADAQMTADGGKRT